MDIKIIQNLSILIFFLLLSIGHGEVGKITTAIDKKTVVVGEPVTLTMVAETPEKAIVDFPRDPDSFAPFEILERRTQKEEGDAGKRYRVDYKVAVYDTGYAEIPSVPVVVNYYKDNSPVADTLYSQSYTLFCRVSKPDTLKTIHPHADLPGWHIPWWLILLIILVLGAATWLIWRWYIRKKAGALGSYDGYEAPPEPADVTALRKISALKQSDWLKRGEYKKWYSALSDILREYIEKRFDGFNALEMTTSELLPGLNEIMDGEELQKAASFLKLADMVKFARHFPEDENHSLYLSFVEEWVRKNGSRPEPEPEETSEDSEDAQTGEAADAE
jgi:hypothetical protein